MQNNLLSYLEEFAETCKPKVYTSIKTQTDPPIVIQTSEEFEWIVRYCSYKFDHNDNLICANALGKTFIISKNYIRYFKRHEILGTLVLCIHIKHIK